METSPNLTPRCQPPSDRPAPRRTLGRSGASRALWSILVGGLLVWGGPAAGQDASKPAPPSPDEASAEETPAADDDTVQVPAIPPSALPPSDRPHVVTVEASTPLVDAGFGRGATIRSADDQFSLNIRGRIQARASLFEIQGDGRGPETEMIIRRMRLVFQGNALGPLLSYYIQLAFSNLDTESDLRLPLRDAYVTFSPLRDLNLRVGQMKVPFGRQRVVSSSALQMSDRSIVVQELNLDRDVGLALISRDLFGLGGRLAYALGVYGGNGRNRLARDFGYLYAARLEVLPFGSFDDYVEADIRRQRTPRLAIGAGVAYNQNTNRPRSTTGTPYPAGDFDYFHAGGDFVFKMRGFSLTGEVLYRGADRGTQTVAVAGAPVDIASGSGWGAHLQAGQMLTAHVELSARYARLVPTRGADASVPKAQELGGCLSYYVVEHNLKVQSDYFYLPMDGFRDGLHQARVQMQVYF